MFYIYTNEDCPNCQKQKDAWDKEGVKYTERSAERLKKPSAYDEIDVDGFVDLSTKNMKLPAIVERGD
jgi:glutaredoxin